MMSREEIKKDLLNQVKRVYEQVDIIHLDLNEEEVELRFHVQEKDREGIKGFYHNNRQVFQDETEDTENDLHTIDQVSIRLDGQGIYFGKSSYDLLATNVAAFYLLEKYLNPLIEELPTLLKEYRALQMVQ